jgi:hypothetical protein
MFLRTYLELPGAPRRNETRARGTLQARAAPGRGQARRRNLVEPQPHQVHIDTRRVQAKPAPRRKRSHRDSYNAGRFLVRRGPSGAPSRDVPAAKGRCEPLKALGVARDAWPIRRRPRLQEHPLAMGSQFSYLRGSAVRPIRVYPLTTLLPDIGLPGRPIVAAHTAHDCIMKGHPSCRCPAASARAASPRPLGLAPCFGVTPRGPSCVVSSRRSGPPRPSGDCVAARRAPDRRSRANRAGC